MAQGTTGFTTSGNLETSLTLPGFLHKTGYFFFFSCLTAGGTFNEMKHGKNLSVSGKCWLPGGGVHVALRGPSSALGAASHWVLPTQRSPACVSRWHHRGVSAAVRAPRAPEEEEAVAGQKSRRAPPTVPIQREQSLDVQRVLSSHVPCGCFLTAGGQTQRAASEPPTPRPRCPPRLLPVKTLEP